MTQQEIEALAYWQRQITMHAMADRMGGSEELDYAHARSEHEKLVKKLGRKATLAADLYDAKQKLKSVIEDMRKGLKMDHYFRAFRADYKYALKKYLEAK